jgi:hypothetical protein
MNDPITINDVLRNAALIFEANRAARDRGVLSLWTVYDHPKDYPDGFIARRFETGGGKPDAVATADVVTGDLATIRESMTMCGLHRMARAPSDQSKIVETWM